MEFTLFEKLASLEGMELALLIAAAAAAVALAVFAVRGSKKHAKAEAPKKADTRALVTGALCVAMAFVLSYMKLFSMPLGGSVTLCSMLPVVLYAYLYGPSRGFAAALAYSLLQVAQGAYIVHWAQFLLDYIFAFTCLGAGGFFKKSLPAGMAVAGLLRMALSTLSGVVFFASSATDAGYSSIFGYSLLYNASTVGIETVLCVAVAAIPAFSRAVKRLGRA